MEMGLEDGIRGNRLVQVALRNAGIRPVHYYGIDLFEAHEDPEDRISLKEAHKEFTALGAKVKLIPGDPFSALARSANSIKGVDLVVIGHDQDPESVQRAWMYLPRILSEDGVVLKQGLEEEDYKFQVIDRQKLDEIVKGSKSSKKKAA